MLVKETANFVLLPVIFVKDAVNKLIRVFEWVVAFSKLVEWVEGRSWRV
tara:strand:+ start:2811 stop:2957 length:147 start_codon:yes stop_codon:yes gene_type:complete